MRDMVEIGMGRTARRTYELDDINIVPSRRTRSSQDVSTTWQLDAYRFEIPVVSHPTDALVSPEFAIEMGRCGGLGVLNGEGLIGRHADVVRGPPLEEVVLRLRRFRGFRVAARTVVQARPGGRAIGCNLGRPVGKLIGPCSLWRHRGRRREQKLHADCDNRNARQTNHREGEVADSRGSLFLLELPSRQVQ